MRRSLDANAEFTAGRWGAHVRKKRATACLRHSLRRAQTLNYSGLERETGLEPATACLEGRYLLFHRLHVTKPLKIGASRVRILYAISVSGRHPPTLSCLPHCSRLSRNPTIAQIAFSLIHLISSCVFLTTQLADELMMASYSQVSQVVRHTMLTRLLGTNTQGAWFACGTNSCTDGLSGMGERFSRARIVSHIFAHYDGPRERSDMWERGERYGLVPATRPRLYASQATGELSLPCRSHATGKLFLGLG